MISYDDYTENRLIDLFKEGDQQAFTALYERHRMDIYKHAFLFYQDYDKAQDVVQDVFTKLWYKRDSIHIQSNFSAYLHKMVRYSILNQLAREKTAQKYFDHVEYTQEKYRSSVDEYVIEKELSEILKKKIDKLPHKMREIFILSREEQLSHGEISERLNVTTKTVRQQIYNALLRIKSDLKYIFIFFI